MYYLRISSRFVCFMLLLFAAFASLAANNKGWVDSCSWDNPGQSVYQHRPVKALLSYDISTEQRHDLTAKMAQLRYDDVATISRDGIVSDRGTAEYVNLRAMHFGNGRVCRTVTRSKWTDSMKEVGLVYCSVAGGNREVCVIVPTVCNNVSLVDRKLLSGMGPAGPQMGLGAPMGPINYLGTAPMPKDATELVFEPPTAGKIEPALTPVAQLRPDPTQYGLPVLWGVYQTSPIPGGVYLAPPPVPDIPEPSTWILLGLGLAFLLASTRNNWNHK